MAIDLNYFIALCALYVASLIVQYALYNKAIKERDAFAAMLGLYIQKFGKQSFSINGDEFRVE